MLTLWITILAKIHQDCFSIWLVFLGVFGIFSTQLCPKVTTRAFKDTTTGVHLLIKLGFKHHYSSQEVSH